MPFRKLKHMPTMLSVMTAFPYSIDAHASLREARDMMAGHDIHHLPVKLHGDLAGVVTAKDISLALEGCLDVATRETALRVVDVAVLDAYVVSIHTPLDRVLIHMADNHIGSALVTKGGRLAGLFTLTDACRVFAEHLRAQFPAYDGGGNDAA